MKDRTSTLHLVLKSQWYDMIDADIKTEEYREIKPYWEKRLLDHKAISDHVDKNIKVMMYNLFNGKAYPPLEDPPHQFPRGYKRVVFRRGYHRDAPSMTFVIKDICFGKGRPEWGAPTNREVFIIKLGKRLLLSGC